MIKAIETEYKGCRFRSRTEARWAVFFDALDWSWQFEQEGFELKSGRYLSDFLVQIPGHGPTWFEVKPFKDDCRDDPRWTELAVGSGVRVITAYGMHRTGDGCTAAWAQGRTAPHMGRLCTPRGEKFRLGPFWTTPEYTAAWDAASGARFEFGESGPKKTRKKRK